MFYVWCVCVFILSYYNTLLLLMSSFNHACLWLIASVYISCRLVHISKRINKETKAVFLLFSLSDFPATSQFSQLWSLQPSPSATLILSKLNCCMYLIFWFFSIWVTSLCFVCVLVCVTGVVVVADEYGALKVILFVMLFIWGVGS